MADNPTTRLAEQARISYQKVEQGQAQQVEAGERGLERQQQGIGQGAQMLQQQGQFEEQLGAQKEESQARLGQQKQQFEAEQGLQREKMAQDQAQFDKAQQLETQKAVAQRSVQQGQLDLSEREFAVKQKQETAEQEIELSKLRQRADETLAKQRTEREQYVNERRDYYRKEIGGLRSAKEKLLFSKNDDELNAVMTGVIAEKLGANKSVAGALDGIRSGQASPETLKAVTDAIDNYTIKTMVDQAQELGEWTPPPHLIQHPDVQRFNAFMGEAQNAFNTQFQRQMLSAMQEGGGKVSELVALHADPEARDRRLARAASRAMRLWYRTRNMRDAMTQAQVEGQGQAPR